MVLSSINGNCCHNLRGRRIGLKFLVRETGNPPGEIISIMMGGNAPA